MHIPNPNDVKRLADQLLAAEDQAAKLRAQWAALFIGEPEEGEEEDGSKGTLADRIVELINGKFEQTFTSARVSSELNAKPNSVGPTLSRLVAERKIRKVGHGEYRGFTPPMPWLVEPKSEPEQQSPEALVG